MMECQAFTRILCEDFFYKTLLIQVQWQIISETLIERRFVYPYWYDRLSILIL